MDTSETYIKMCEKAKKILPPKKVEIGDYWICERFYPPQFGTYDEEDMVVQKGNDWQDPMLRPWCGFADSQDDYEQMVADSFPLYRQDQLQEMVLPNPDAHDTWGFPLENDMKIDPVFWLVHRFADSIQERKYSQQTMEQLWLLFVMKEKFSKAWDGVDWNSVKVKGG